MIDIFTYLLTMSIGYVISFILAAYIGPRIADKLSGKFSLYLSMIILSITILGTFSLSIATLLYFFGEDLAAILPLVIVYAIISNLVVYLISPWLIDLFFNARKDEYLQEIVDRVKEKAGYKGNITALVAKGPPNAFAYGNILSGKKIAVTNSLINILDEEELEAVIGHEIGHHKHKDSILMLLFGLLPAIIYYLGVILTRYSFYRRKGSEGFILAIFGIFLVVLSFLVQILVLAFSRLREYYADYTGAKSSSKKSMQKALAKIYNYYNSNKNVLETVKNSPTSTLFIYALINPFINITDEDIERIKQLKENSYLEIFQTHPSISKRLIFLDKIK